MSRPITCIWHSATNWQDVFGDSEEHIEGTSAGGMPVRVKCLHVLLAQSLVMGPGVNPIGDLVSGNAKDESDPIRPPLHAGRLINR